MSSLLPMQTLILPMDTLPHWPEVVEPSLLLALWVTLGIPIVIALGVTLLVWVPGLARMARGGSRGGVGAFWVNPGSLRPAGIDTDDDLAPYTMGERESLVRAVRQAEAATGLDFSVYLGPPEGAPAEDFAIDLLDSLPDPERSLLVYWDPATEALEFVTGDETDLAVTAEDLAQAEAQVRTSVELEMPVDGLVRAINLLAQHARVPDSIAADERAEVTA